jgi:outer membrane protein
MEAGYKLGTQTMVDVLSAQDNLFDNQTTFAQDLYAYLMTTLQLKEASGSLSANDILTINKWLEQPVEKKA